MSQYNFTYFYWKDPLQSLSTELQKSTDGRSSFYYVNKLRLTGLAAALKAGVSTLATLNNGYGHYLFKDEYDY